MSVEFSVIIPTFRRPRELREAIDSVLAQSEVTVEIVVVDDSPEGSAREVVERLNDPRLTLLINPNPSGGFPSVVRNLGWPRAKGDFIHFLDDDDIVPAGHYAAVKEAFAAHPEAGLVFGKIEPFGSGPAEQLAQERVFFADAARKAAACQRFGPKWGFIGYMLFDKVFMVCSSSVLRRECVFHLGGYDPKIRLMEDGEFHIRAIRSCGAYFMDRVVLNYRIGSPSLMHSPNPTQTQIDQEREGRQLMNLNYRKKYGPLEYYLMGSLVKAFRAIDRFSTRGRLGTDDHDNLQDRRKDPTHK
jgi:glycosyltransferase involved in cell wall biosynthesis